jgi:putative transposase
MANINRNIVEPLLFHSDRGIQYACKEFANCLKSNILVKQSMSRKGNCWDNAVAESFFKTIKTELIYHHKYKTRMEAELQIFKYIETWYNRMRRHSALNGKSILEFNQINNLKSAA